MKKYLMGIVIVVCSSIVSFSDELPFQYGDIYLGMENKQLLEVIKNYDYLNLDKVYLISDYHDASVMINIGENDKIEDITIKKDMIDPTKEFFEQVNAYSKVYGKPIKQDKEKTYFEFVKDGKIVVLKYNKVETNYIFFILFAQSRETKGYKNLVLASN